MYDIDDATTRVILTMAMVKMMMMMMALDSRFVKEVKS